MTKKEVLTLLESNKNPRGIAHWERTGNDPGSYGPGITSLRKLARKIGLDHALAGELREAPTVDYSDYSCKAVNCVTHLTSDIVERKIMQKNK